MIKSRSRTDPRPPSHSRKARHLSLQIPSLDLDWYRTHGFDIPKPITGSQSQTRATRYQLVLGKVNDRVLNDVMAYSKVNLLSELPHLTSKDGLTQESR